MLKYILLFCLSVCIHTLCLAQDIKKTFESFTYLDLKGDTVKPVSDKKRIYICIAPHSCGLCFFQLEAFFNTLDTSKFELAVIIQSTHANKHLIQSKYGFIKKIKTVYHIPIQNDFEKDCKSGLLKLINACGNPSIIITSKNNQSVELIKYKYTFTKDGYISKHFKLRIIEFLKQ